MRGFGPPRLPTPARIAAAALVAAAGAMHLYLWFDYFHRVHVVGALFLVNAATGLVLGAGLLASGALPVLLASAGYALGTLAAFAVSVRWGLFGYRESLWGRWQEAAGAAEVAAVLVLVSGLARTRLGARRRRGYVDAPPASSV